MRPRSLASGRGDEQELVALGHRLLDDRRGERSEQVALDGPLSGRAPSSGLKPLLDEELVRRVVDLDRPGAAAQTAPREHVASSLSSSARIADALERAEDDDAVDAG